MCFPPFFVALMTNVEKTQTKKSRTHTTEVAIFLCKGYNTWETYYYSRVISPSLDHVYKILLHKFTSSWCNKNSGHMTDYCR